MFWKWCSVYLLPGCLASPPPLPTPLTGWPEISNVKGGNPTRWRESMGGACPSCRRKGKPPEVGFWTRRRSERGRASLFSSKHERASWWGNTSGCSNPTSTTPKAWSSGDARPIPMVRSKFLDAVDAIVVADVVTTAVIPAEQSTFLVASPVKVNNSQRVSSYYL